MLSDLVCNPRYHAPFQASSELPAFEWKPPLVVLLTWTYLVSAVVVLSLSLGSHGSCLWFTFHGFDRLLAHPPVSYPPPDLFSLSFGFVDLDSLLGFLSDQRRCPRSCLILWLTYLSHIVEPKDHLKHPKHFLCCYSLWWCAQIYNVNLKINIL